MTSLLFALPLMLASPAAAEEPEQDSQSNLVSVPAMKDAPPPKADPPAKEAAPQWMAELSGGYAKRDSGPSGAFAIAALNRRMGQMYVRAGVTSYRSIIEQTDTALPSTYVVGSVGTGGNFHNWVFDAWASYGWQYYGLVQTMRGERASTSRGGSPYLSVGFDAGRMFTLAKGLYVTPTIGATYAHNRLLRPSPDVDHWPDYESDERTWTGTAALRVDKTFGKERQHYIGLAASWHITNNGLSVLVPPMENDGQFSTVHLADGWGEIGANAGFRLSPRWRLETSVSRSVQALAGNSITASAGVRLAF